MGNDGDHLEKFFHRHIGLSSELETVLEVADKKKTATTTILKPTLIRTRHSYEYIRAIEAGLAATNHHHQSQRDGNLLSERTVISPSIKFSFFENKNYQKSKKNNSCTTTIAPPTLNSNNLNFCN